VVDLRVMFSVHKSHYDDLVRARCTGITDVYAAQLGHMVGYMFNRVATPGWEDEEELKRTAKGLKKRLVDREEVRLKQLLAADGQKCAIAGCEKQAGTYRWLMLAAHDRDAQERECVLCLEHARQYDYGRLSHENTIREGI
jgi:hypothetical protein